MLRLILDTANDFRTDFDRADDEDRTAIRRRYEDLIASWEPTECDEIDALNDLCRAIARAA